MTPKKSDYLKTKLKVRGKNYELGKVILEEEFGFIEPGEDEGKKIIPFISKSGIKRIINKFKLKITFLCLNEKGKEMETSIPNIQKLGQYIHFIWCKVCSGSKGDRSSIEIGSINTYRNSDISGQFPVETIYKRAKGRAVLDYVGLYDLYIEDELTGIKAKAKAKLKKKKATVKKKTKKEITKRL